MNRHTRGSQDSLFICVLSLTVGKRNFMAKTSEDPLDKMIRWMTENLNGAYTAVHPKGHPHEDDHCTNSGTCILAFCYINSLGKILLRGGGKDFDRFNTFLRLCMSDFVSESNARGLSSTPTARKSGGDGWLYEVFRCGFVHAFYPSSKDVAWGRNPHSNKYWFTDKKRLTLNIDQLVRGFLKGTEEFKRRLREDPDLQSRFKEHLLA